MKRILAACLLETIVFQQKDDVEKALAATLVKEEIAKYKSNLERDRTKFKIMEEVTQPNGSVVLKIMRQYNKYKTGDYMA